MTTRKFIATRASYNGVDFDDPDILFIAANSRAEAEESRAREVTDRNGYVGPLVELPTDHAEEISRVIVDAFTSEEWRIKALQYARRDKAVRTLQQLGATPDGGVEAYDTPTLIALSEVAEKAAKTMSDAYYVRPAKPIEMPRGVIGSPRLATDEEVSELRKALEAPKSDPVDHPSHYGGAGSVYETIKVLSAWMVKGELRGFCIGNAIKYISRAGKKGFYLEDLKKARWYLDYLIETEEKKTLTQFDEAPNLRKAE